jgi:hypothetical protein
MWECFQPVYSEYIFSPPELRSKISSSAAYIERRCLSTAAGGSVVVGTISYSSST